MNKAIKARLLVSASLLVSVFSAHSGPLWGANARELWQPYYVMPRNGSQHIDLSGTWDLAYREAQIQSANDISSIKGWFQATVPSTVQIALYKTGELPHPYYNLNSQKYEWVDEKVWYYRKTETIPESAKDNYVFLCFNGIDYFSRVWLNGELLGEHQGMFGGPIIEISNKVRFGGTNEIVVEVRAGNWGQKNIFKARDPGAIIKPWVIAGGTGAEMFFPLGMWQSARIEIVPKVHLERPFLVTKAVGPGEARLQLNVEVLAGTQSLEHELHPTGNVQMRYYRDWWRISPAPGELTMRFSLCDRSTGKAAFEQRFLLHTLEGRNWIRRDIVVPNPQLWWPNGMGDPYLYRAELVLIQNEKPIDRIAFEYGIRRLETEFTAGPQVSDRWAKWQFVMNGRRMFVKGINWMPADILLDLSSEKYEWLLNAAKNAGIQLVRVWGGGILETEEFYSVANRLGIMVWQDFPIGNTVTPEFPQAVWEAQVMQTIFRLRNHPSLVLYCGGNEFNPYAVGNAATIGILERSLADFDSTRPFRRTSPDSGSMHDYPDMDPTWYARKFPYLPYMSETGMHNVPNAETMREVVDAQELAKPLSNMYEEDFGTRFPDFRHHFVEFQATRVPRMLSRASHIADISAPTIEELAEATQIGAGEFYQVMSEALQANYPVTAGLMPWVFKRPWPVVAIQLVDGFGQPTAPYYFLKRTYEPTHIQVRIPHLLWAPGETVPLPIAVTHSSPAGLVGLSAEIAVFDDSFQRLWHKALTLDISGGPSVTTASSGSFEIPPDYRDRYLFVLAELRDGKGNLMSRASYWPRSLAMLSDPRVHNSFRETPKEWPEFKEGPWLKAQVAKTTTTLELRQVLPMQTSGRRSTFAVEVRNTGQVPAFPAQLTVSGARRSFFASDNFFWLAPGEERRISLEVLWREDPVPEKFRVSGRAWNAREVSISPE